MRLPNFTSEIKRVRATFCSGYVPCVLSVCFFIRVQGTRISDTSAIEALDANVREAL